MGHAERRRPAGKKMIISESWPSQNQKGFFDGSNTPLGDNMIKRI